MSHDPMIRLFESVPVLDEQQERIDMLRAKFIELATLVRQSCVYLPAAQIALDKLLEAKDAAVRGVVFERGW